MSNEQKVKSITKLVLIIVFLLFLLVIGIILYRDNKSARIEDKLKKQKYKEVTKKIYSKNTTKDNSEITYVYNLVSNDITKTIVTGNELISLLYTNKRIKINYSFSNKNGCRITQTGLYNDSDFNCKITSMQGECKTKCNVMLKEAKTFYKEVKKF